MVTVDRRTRSALLDARAGWPWRSAVPRIGQISLLSVGLFLAARLVTSLFLLWLTTQTGTQSQAGVAPSFLEISSVWDGRWYAQIAAHGYPHVLPVDAHGQVQQNAWAFLPAYPYLTKVLALVTGAQWSLVAVVVSICFGAGAAVLLAVLLTPRVGGRAALFSVALFSCSPVSFMLQMTYADSMMACLLFGTLCLLERRRYLSAIPVVVIASMTRPGVLALALACLLLMIRDRRVIWRSKRIPAAVALLVASGLGGLAWPAIVAIGTGDPAAYFRTETAWRSLWTGQQGFTAFEPWLFAAEQVLGVAGLPVLALGLAAAIYFLIRPASVLGSTSRAWMGSYGLYLLAVFMPQTSLPRLLIPMAPAFGAIRVPSSRIVLVTVLAVSTAVQLLWLWCTYGPVETYLTVP